FNPSIALHRRGHALLIRSLAEENNMLLLAPAATFLGVRTCTTAAALLSFTDLKLAFVPPLAGSSRMWRNEEHARRARTRSRLPAEVRPTRRAPACSVRAKRLAGGESSDGVGRQQAGTG
ncbi:unnamed protein product, partial [Ectocarpus sp. 12 AP-2014]